MTDFFDDIKATWKKADEVITTDQSLTPEVIKQSITSDSISITSRMLRMINSSLIMLLVNALLLLINCSFYLKVPVYLGAISLSALLCLILVHYLFKQMKRLKTLDAKQADLHQVLQDKIDFFNHAFNRAMFAYGFAVMLLPFNVNLYQERANGGFKGLDLLLLVGFYILAFAFSYVLIKMTYSVYLKQLKNALSNLEQSTLVNMEEELKMNRKRNRIIGAIMVLFVLLGGVAYVVFHSSSLSGQTDLPDIEPTREKVLAEWLQVNGVKPVDYITQCFTDHDVVFLGEYHRIKHDVLLVQSLIEPLYRKGIRQLATEFGRREDQALIDSLLSADVWYEDLARKIVFQQFVWWGYQEYVDIYKSAWQLNHSLPDGSVPFSILGINDSPDWSLIRKAADHDDHSVKSRVWRGGGEHMWASVILDAVSAGEKVLVHCGIHHAFTGYRQPIVIDGKFSHFDKSLRCGNHVYSDLGKRAITVFLHSPWSDSTGYGGRALYPAGGIIDALMRKTGTQATGFDLTGGPFGNLDMGNAVYKHGYEHTVLQQFCDGWIYTVPFPEYEGVTPISNWIHLDNIYHARQQSPNPRYRDATTERFNKGITRSANIRKRFRHLK